MSQDLVMVAQNGGEKEAKKEKDCQDIDQDNPKDLTGTNPEDISESISKVTDSNDLAKVGNQVLGQDA